MNSITIRKPDDMHTHLRDGAMLEAVLPLTLKQFRRAIVMPNLAPNPVITTDDLLAYRSRIIALLNSGAFTPPTPGLSSVDNSRSPLGIGVNSEQSLFTPLMTYYLTEQSSPTDISRGFKEGVASAVKLYPSNATTNSAMGVGDIENVYKVFEQMEKDGMPILLHGETVLKDGKEIDSKDREKVFLDTTLPKLLKDFPGLKIVLEHATTKDAVDFILNEKSPCLGSTITLHHLMVNEGDVADAEKNAYLHCMPIIKSEENQKALRKAATSGEPYFFLGTDSAPHPVSAKEKEKPAAGVFTIPAAIEMYANVFEEMGKLENLEAFASLNGPRFYDLQPNEEKITLAKEAWTIDALVDVEGGEKIRPFGYDEDPAKRTVINWRLA